MSRIARRALHARPWVAAAAAAFAVALMATAVGAQGIDTNSPLLPPLDGVYLSPAGVHATYNGPALQIVLSNVRHSGFANVVTTSIPGGTQENFDSVVTASVAVDFGPDSFFDVFFDITMTGPTSVDVLDGYTPGTSGTFQTEMVQLDLTGITPLGVAQLRETPTQPSQGVTTITDIGAGMYHIDSFFDVFTELSLDGGANWIPSTGPTHVDLMPEPSSLVLLSLGAIALAAVAARRRRMLRAR